MLIDANYSVVMLNLILPKLFEARMEKKPNRKLLFNADYSIKDTVQALLLKWLVWVHSRHSDSEYLNRLAKKTAGRINFLCDYFAMSSSVLR